MEELKRILDDANPEGDHGTIAAVTALLGRERSCLASLAPTVPGDRQDDRCGACGSRLSVKDELCSPCRERRDKGGIDKKLEEQAKTFEDLVEGTGSRMMAVLYADGANVGSAFRKLTSMAQHRALSQEYWGRKGTGSAVVRFLERYLTDSEVESSDGFRGSRRPFQRTPP